MPIWKISVKNGGYVNSCHLEKGMSVEIVTNSSSDPRMYGDGMNAIAKAFSQKYGFEERNVRGMNSQYQFDAEKI